MKFSFNTMGCPDWSWEKIVDEACRLGYDGIEIRCIERERDFSRMKPFLPDNIDKTMKLLREKNLEICCLSTACKFHDSDSFERNVEGGKAAIDLARELQCKYIRVFGDDIPDGENEEKVIRRIAGGIGELGSYAAERGVTVLVESHGKFSCSEKLLKLLGCITGEGVDVLWDPANAYTHCGESMEESFEGVRNRIRITHVKDIKGKYPNTNYCMIGEGVLSAEKLIKLLKSADYGGWLSLEWEKMWHPELEEPDIAFEVYIKHIKSFL